MQGSLRTRYSRNLPDLYAPTVRLSDSLLLTPPQLAALDSANRVWQVRLDTIWKDMAARMYAMPDDYQTSKALEVQETMLDRAWEAL